MSYYINYFKLISFATSLAHFDNFTTNKIKNHLYSRRFVIYDRYIENISKRNDICRGREIFWTTSKCRVSCVSELNNPNKVHNLIYGSG